MNKTAKIFLTTALLISMAPAYADSKKENGSYKNKGNYSFEPGPPKSVREVKTEILVRTKGKKSKPIKVKDKELKKLLEAVNILVDNEQKKEAKKIKLNWYRKTKKAQYKVIADTVKRKSITPDVGASK